MRMLIVVGLALWATTASAAEYTSLGHGNASCGRWQEERRKPNPQYRFLLQAWVLGYITRANYEVGGDLTAGTDELGVFAWIDNYCRANPLKNVAAAAEALVDTLGKPKR